MKQLILLTIALSIFDVSHDKSVVVIEGCEGSHCVRIVSKRDVLDDEAALDNIAEKIRSQLETR